MVSEALAEEVTGFHVHRGALASLQRRPLSTPAEVLDGARTVLVLEDVVDHTNVGAILRSGAALGVDAVLLSPRCADPLYRRSVKVGMGAVFSMPWTRLDDWYDALPTLAAHGFTTVALTLADDALPVEEAVSGVDRLALVLGTEGHGLSPRWTSSASRRAVIPMAVGIDSLNVAAACAVACYVAQPTLSGRADPSVPGVVARPLAVAARAVPSVGGRPPSARPRPQILRTAAHRCRAAGPLQVGVPAPCFSHASAASALRRQWL